MPSEVHFTRAQKWDLVRISAAAVASMVFFTVPMFLVRPQEAASQTDNRRQPMTLAALSDAPAPTLAASNASSASSKSSPETASVSVVTSTEFAVVTAPPLQSPTAAMRARTSKPAQLRARANTQPPTSSFSRRVARFIAGSGKYNVRPFPTITTSGS